MKLRAALNVKESDLVFEEVHPVGLDPKELMEWPAESYES